MHTPINLGTKEHVNNCSPDSWSGNIGMGSRKSCEQEQRWSAEPRNAMAALTWNKSEAAKVTILRASNFQHLEQNFHHKGFSMKNSLEKPRLTEKNTLIPPFFHKCGGKHSKILSENESTKDKLDRGGPIFPTSLQRLCAWALNGQNEHFMKNIQSTTFNKMLSKSPHIRGDLIVGHFVSSDFIDIRFVSYFGSPKAGK